MQSGEGKRMLFADFIISLQRVRVVRSLHSGATGTHGAHT